MFLSFSNKQEDLEEEGRVPGSLLCIPRIANKVPSTPELFFSFSWNYLTGDKPSGSKRKGVCLFSNKRFIVRDVKSKGT